MRRALICGLALVLAACAAPDKYSDIAALETELRRSGYLRTERNPADITVSNRQLVRNFREIMLYDEYDVEDGRYVARRVPRNLVKLDGPVGYWAYGETVDEIDQKHIDALAARIGRATGLRISPNWENPTIQIMILTRAERIALADEIDNGDTDSPFIDDLRNDLGETLCAAYPITSLEDDTLYGYAVVIPGELSGLMRQSCIEEEFGQAFGPAADFEGARPSVFNDDEEFALFTAHDEMLLRILYDDRLRHGMTEAQAMPIVERIVAEIRPSPAPKSSGQDAKRLLR